jgi:glutathione S-transferase
MRLYDYAASGNCLKVRILLGLLARKYERVPVDIFAGETLTPEYGALNPARETPVLEVDSGVLLQSNAILWYLAEGTPYLPADAWARSQVLQWLMFEQEHVIPGIAAPRFWLMTSRASAKQIDAYRELGRRALRRLEDELSQREFLAGDFSIADVSVYAYTHVSPDAALELDEWPNLCRWLTRVEAIPRFVNDLIPYPENATRGLSRSIYD